MRIGVYGLPTAGKTFLLDQVKSLEVLSGSGLLENVCSDFRALSKMEKDQARKELARRLQNRDSFIMDGHYAFGDEVVFTEEDGELYHVFLYLYVKPEILEERMKNSPRNKKYLEFSVKDWQNMELEALRQYCHIHNKDFYVLDNPVEGYFSDLSPVLAFLEEILRGYSCVDYARKCARNILEKAKGEGVALTDGDRTLILEDSSAQLGYHTHLFDGNFYTGFQVWRHAGELADFLRRRDMWERSGDQIDVHLNQKVRKLLQEPCFLLTSGCLEAWGPLARGLGMDLYYGSQMAADTKYFIAKFLQEAGKRVLAFGDSMNDYFMLRQADKAYLALRPDGSVSKSLKNRDMEGIKYV